MVSLPSDSEATGVLENHQVLLAGRAGPILAWFITLIKEHVSAIIHPFKSVSHVKSVDELMCVTNVYVSIK